MTRASAVLVAFFVTLSSSWGFASAEHVVEDKPFSEAYVDAVKAEHQLMLTLLTKEKSRLESLQELRSGGHASWLEVRKQQLNFDQQRTACEMFGRFGKFVDNLENLAAPQHWNRQTIGKMPFTDLMLSSQQHDKEQLDVDQLWQDYQTMIAQQRAARDKLEFELNSLTASDPWRKGYRMRLQVATAELKASQAEALLLDKFRSLDRNHDLPETTEFASTLTDSNLAKSICSQCEAHVKLIEHSLESESLRHSKLIELQKLGVGSQRDIDAVSQRRDELAMMKQLQTSVMKYLHEIEEEPAVASEINLDPAMQNNAWEEIRNQFSQLEATAQYEAAKLEKEMLTEVLHRLEGAAANNSATLTGNHLSASLAAGQNAELQNYRNRIKSVDLQMQLALTRQHSLQQHRLTNTYVVAMKENPSADSELQISLRAATPLGSKAMLSGFLTTSPKATPSANVLFLSHVGFGSYSSCPTRFGNLYTGYQSVQLLDNSRLLPLSSPDRLSLKSPFSRSSLNLTPNRSSNSALFTKRDFGSTYLYRRSLPTFRRPYQNGILRPEYRKFLTPGQPPWLFPGSPANFGASPFRNSYRY